MMLLPLLWNALVSQQLAQHILHPALHSEYLTMD